MKKSLMVAFFIVCLIPHALLALSVEEIEKLQKLGFSNEQIVEMSKNSPTTKDESKVEVDAETIKTMNKLKEEGKGLLVVCASKEWADKGPGYLDVWVGAKGAKKEKIGKADIKEYSKDGQKGATTFSHIEFNSPYLADYTVANTSDIVTSRYYSEFELKEGTYEVALQRLFIVSKTALGTEKEDRHKFFHNLKIVSGKATIVSYFWQANAEFGLDAVMSGNHNKMIEYVSSKFGTHLAEVNVNSQGN